MLCIFKNQLLNMVTGEWGDDMKFAIVSDIHGNLSALNFFIEYIEKEEINIILNLGDTLAGEFPKEVFKKVFNDSRFINIKGNHENMFTAFDYELLGRDIIFVLGKLPLKKIVKIEGISFLMVHSRENSNTDIPLLYNGGTINEFLSDYKSNVDYVLMGHTHFPMMVGHYGEKTIINPGSLGLSYDRKACFCICEINEGDVTFSFKKLNIK